MKRASPLSYSRAKRRKAYPFDYRFTVRYVFEELSFKVFLKLENLGNQPILWSAGHHFYFTLPWHDGLERSDYRFKIPAKKCFRHAADGSLEPVKPLRKRATLANLRTATASSQI